MLQIGKNKQKDLKSIEEYKDLVPLHTDKSFV